MASLILTVVFWYGNIYVHQQRIYFFCRVSGWLAMLWTHPLMAAFSVSGCASAAFSIKLSTGPLGARDFNFHGLAHFAGDVGSWIVIGCSEFPIRIDQHEVVCFAQKPSYWPIYMVNPNILHHPIMPSWTPGSPQRFLSTWLIQPAAGDFFNPFWSFLVFLSAGFDNLGFDQAKVREALQAIGNPADKEAAINWFLRPQLPWWMIGYMVVSNSFKTWFLFSIIYGIILPID